MNLIAKTQSLLRPYRYSKPVRDAMATHRKRCPACAWCGSADAVDVHHIIPMYIAPEQGADIDNLITLCSARCHYVVGHLCNWKFFQASVKRMCLNYGEDA